MILDGGMIDSVEFFLQNYIEDMISPIMMKSLALMFLYGYQIWMGHTDDRMEFKAHEVTGVNTYCNSGEKPLLLFVQDIKEI